MDDADYHTNDLYCKITNDTNNSSSSRPLKLFGFNINSDEENRDQNPRKLSPILESRDQSNNLIQPATSDIGNHKYECQYCNREFANSQALGGHQNAHKKERQLLKQAQILQSKYSSNMMIPSFTTTSQFVHNKPMPSAFMSHPHLAVMPTQPSPWFYAGSRAPLQLPHGGRGVGRESATLRVLSQVGVSGNHAKVFQGFSGWTVRNSENGGQHTQLDKGLGLDLHLGIGPTAN